MKIGTFQSAFVAREFIKGLTGRMDNVCDPKSCAPEGRRSISDGHFPKFRKLAQAMHSELVSPFIRKCTCVHIEFAHLKLSKCTRRSCTGEKEFCSSRGSTATSL